MSENGNEKFPFGFVRRHHRGLLVLAHIITGLLMIGIVVCACLDTPRAILWMQVMGWMGVLVALKFCMSIQAAIYHKRLSDS